MLSTVCLIALVGLATSGSSGRAQGRPTSLAPETLAELWDREHLNLPLPPLITHADVESRLQQMRRESPEFFQLEEIGRSVEGRSINHLWFGSGPFHVLLWSQMHGDEPTATAALFDLVAYVRRHRADASVRQLLEALTVHMVPMLNPDGAERFQRRNAQGIDINRDALMLQTPEGRALKAIRDRLNPRLGFNLHNQNWRTSAGKTGRPASISLLAVSYDEARSDNEGRILAKKICSVIRDALEPFASGQLARYDDEFEERAFGDNLTKWGTPVVLIETGAWPSDTPDQPLVRLNFVAIVSALDALASGRAAGTDPTRYESLPMNDSNVLYRLIKGGTVVSGSGVSPFTADVGIVASRLVRQEGGRRTLGVNARIEELGDLRVFGALETIDAEGLTVTPLFDPAVRMGQEIRLPDWARQDAPRTVQVGQPARLLLLRPAGRDGAYRVEQVIRIGE